MACGAYHGKGVDDPEIRGMFTREYLLASDWYAERLRTKQKRDVALWTRHVRALEEVLVGRTKPIGLDLGGRLVEARKQLAWVSAPDYLSELRGTIGADPFGSGPLPAVTARYGADSVRV
jgi:hypothetical protein